MAETLGTSLKNDFYCNSQSLRLRHLAPFDLVISINHHTKSQGPNEKYIYFTRGRFQPCPAYTARI